MLKYYEKINEVLKDASSDQKMHSHEISGFLFEVEDTLYQHGLYMKKRRPFKMSIKCSNKLKISSEDQGEEFNYYGTTKTWK